MLIVITSGMVNSDRFSNGIRETLGPALEKVTPTLISSNHTALHVISSNRTLLHAQR